WDLNLGPVLDDHAVAALAGEAGGGAPDRAGARDPGQGLRLLIPDPGRRVHLVPAAVDQVVEEVEAAGVEVDPGCPQAAGSVRRDRIDEVGGGAGARLPPRRAVPVQLSDLGRRPGGEDGPP